MYDVEQSRTIVATDPESPAVKTKITENVAENVNAAQKLVGDGTLDIVAACAFSGLGRTFLYQMMDAGKLRYAKVGKRRLIPKAELVRLLAEGLVTPH
jgi:excisionase family DNA binding protein